jgi:hypothetical protein
MAAQEKPLFRRPKYSRFCSFKCCCTKKPLFYITATPSFFGDNVNRRHHAEVHLDDGFTPHIHSSYQSIKRIDCALKMHYDPVQKAYVDTESGEVVYKDEDGVEMNNINGQHSRTDSSRSSTYTPTVARPQYTPLSKQRGSTVAPSPESNSLTLEQQLYDIHVSGVEAVEPTIEGPADHHAWDDWTLARTLQALEFEIPNEAMEGIVQGRFSLRSLFSWVCLT